MTLKIFSNDYESFIVKDLEDLKAFHKEFYGETMEEMDIDIDDYSESGIDEFYNIQIEDSDYSAGDPKIPQNAEIRFRDGIVFVKAIAHEWINSNGRGFLCSTEF
jgi:hypothetical protein